MSKQGIGVLLLSDHMLTNKLSVFRELTTIHKQTPISTVYQIGRYRGVDMYARNWCKRNKIPCVLYDKSLPEPPMRDRDKRKYWFLQMLTTHKPDLVLIWKRTSDSIDMIRTVLAMGYPLKVINEFIWNRNEL